MAISVSIDGRIVAPEDASVSIFDHGFLFGDSVYEVIRTRRGVPVTGAEHLKRLRESAREIYMELPWDDDRIGADIAAALKAGGNAESYIRIMVTRGTGEISLLPDTCRNPRLIVIVKELPVPPPEVARDGIGVVIAGRPRNDSRALAPSAKTGNYLNNLLALVEARRAGAEDAVLLNPAGRLAEGTTSNLFFCRDGVVRTPALRCGILAGITRDLLLRALRGAGITVEEGEYGPEDLRHAAEAFLTSTVRGVAPITRVDGAQVGTGRPGPLTQRAAVLYEMELDRLAAGG